MKKIMEMHGPGHPMRGFAVFAAVMMAVCGIAIAAGGGRLMPLRRERSPEIIH